MTWKCASRHNGVHFFFMSASKSGPNPWCVLFILTWKRSSRLNGTPFFDIATSKSGPYIWSFVYFDLEMCFAPQRHALFRDVNFQMCSESKVFFAFYFQMCFAPQRVQFFMSHPTTWLRTGHFSKPTFRPSGATNHWKNIASRDFPTFSRACIFFLLTLSPP